MDDRATRETMYRAFSTRATEGVHDNSAVLARILELRRMKAALLGYRDFADLVLEERMAKNAERALAFVQELHSKSKDRFDEENAELQAFCRELEGPNAPDLQPWDMGYYAEKQRQALYDFDEEELRPYFELDTVVAGMYDLVERLYGIQVRESRAFPAGTPLSRHTRSLTPTAHSWARSMRIGSLERTSAAARGWTLCLPAVPSPTASIRISD
jgi:oligopeptidase A